MFDLYLELALLESPWVGSRFLPFQNSNFFNNSHQVY